MSLYSIPEVASILNTSAINDLVSDRVFALRAPQDVQAPYITWQPVVAEEVPDWDVPQQQLAKTRVQIDIWARSYNEAAHIAQAVRAAISQASVVMMERAMPDPDTDLARFVVETEFLMT